MKKSISGILISILLISSAFADSGCLLPQILFRNKGVSQFQTISDIQEALLALFGSKLDQIKFTSGIYPLKSEFILRSIQPIAVYLPQEQKVTIEQNTITKSGGKLQISINFEYEFADRTSAGLPRAGLGKGVGKYTESFPVTLSKTAEYSNNKLTWKAQLQDIVLPNMVFLKESGSDLNTKELNTFTQMLNQGVGEKYVPAQFQIQNRIGGIANFVANINNQLVQDIFPTRYQYSFQGQRADYDYTIKGYSLSSIAENIQVSGIIEGLNDQKCFTLALPSTESSYTVVAQSVVDNSYNYLQTTGNLGTQLNINNWKIENFFFTVRDLSWIMPTISNNYQYTDRVQGNCEFKSGDAPTFSQDTNLFTLQAQYSCSLQAVKDQTTVLTFTVDTDQKLRVSFDEIKSIVLQVDSASFLGSEYTSQYKIEKPSLISYYISDAAKLMAGTPVFGTGLFNFENYLNPQWKADTQADTYFLFYDQPPSIVTDQ